MTAAPDRTPLHGRRVTQPPTRGTGLWLAGEINGRPATDDEQAARDRAYARQLERDTALVQVAAPTPKELDLVYAIGPLPWEKK